MVGIGICPDCARKMALNFIHYTCEWCNADIRDLLLFQGYIVLTDERLHRPHYVFPKPDDAARWRDANGLTDCSIVKVLSPRRFKWRKSRGSLTNIKTANRLYHVAQDHRFPRRDPFVFIAPKGYKTRRTVRARQADGSGDDSGSKLASEGDRLVEFFST